MRFPLGALLIAACCSAIVAEENAPPRTFCNPLNLDYGLIDHRGKRIHRHGADPVIVLYEDKYWLFSTWDRPGYRVSDDLVNWRFIPFAGGVELPTNELYTAAAAAVIDGWLYFTEFGTKKQFVSIYRTKDPDGGMWEKVRDELLPPYADPCLFVDPPSGRTFMYYGLERPIFGVELDRNQSFAEVPETSKQMMDTFDPKQHRIRDGWEVCTWDNSESSRPMRGNRTFLPCREGSWMTYYDGKYYLQYASPGTTVPGYADGLLIGDSPLGTFEYSQHSPISRKASGFITSAGHGCLFQDRYGNWWRAVTMLIGVNERMERRIGLYPAGFDADGIPYTRTELGDLPITLPEGPRDHAADVYAGWWRLPGKVVAVSSSLDGHPGTDAGDENIRTWWSAASGGDEREWVQLDLGDAREVRAVQVNLAEQDLAQAVAFEDDVHRFVVEASEDARTWKVIIDRSAATGASPHTYVQLEKAVKARFLKVTNVQTPAGGKFAISDVRAFGVAAGDAPAAVETLSARRDGADRRKVTLTWTPAERANSYLIRYGITPDKLYQHDLVAGGKKAELTLYNLNAEPPYFFRIDALNASGRTEGPASAQAP